MSKFEFRLVENKSDYINKVQPNFIYNRFDILFPQKYDIIEIKYEENILYIPVYFGVITCELGIWLTPMPKEVFDELIAYIFKTYKRIFYIKVSSGVNDYKCTLKRAQETNYWIDLPDTGDEYFAGLVRKVRYNLRRRTERLNEDFENDVQTVRYDKKDIPTDVITNFFKEKKDTRGRSYRLSPTKYLEKYFVTGAYVLKVQNKVVATVFVSETDSCVYMENCSFDHEYATYGVGIMLFVNTIKDEILRGKKQAFFGSSLGGDYKHSLCNRNMETYCLKIGRLKFI